MPDVLTQTTLIIDFITSLGWDVRQELGYPLLPGPFIERSPDKAVFITGTGGPGYVLEGAADASTFQARTRGPQNSQAEAERAATRLAPLIFYRQSPAVLDASNV